MRVAGTEVSFIVLTDKSGRIIGGFTQDDAILTSEIMVLGEKEVGDLRFIPLEDGSIQVAPFQEGAVFPVGTMNSTEFIAKFKELQKQKAEQDGNDNIIVSSNDNSDDLVVDPLEDVEVEDVEILEE